MRKLKLHLLAAIATSLTLTACGGGGGGGGGGSSGGSSGTSAAPVSDINSTNQSEAAETAIQFTEYAFSYAPTTSSQSSSTTSSSSGISTSAELVALDAAIPPALNAKAGQSEELPPGFMQIGSAQLVSSATSSASSSALSCPGGGTFSTTKTKGSSSVNAVGDVYVDAYANCSISGVTRNGSVQRDRTLNDVNNWTYHIAYTSLMAATSSFTEIATGAHDINTLVGSGVTTYTISNGNVSGSSTPSGVSFSVNNLAIKVAVPSSGNLTAFPFKLDTAASLSGSSFGISIEATKPIVRTPSGIFVSGTIKVAGRNSNLFITFLGNDSIKLELDGNGDGTIDQSKITTLTAIRSS